MILRDSHQALGCWGRPADRVHLGLPSPWSRVLAARFPWRSRPGRAAPSSSASRPAEKDSASVVCKASPTNGRAQDKTPFSPLPSPPLPSAPLPSPPLRSHLSFRTGDVLCIARLMGWMELMRFCPTHPGLSLYLLAQSGCVCVCVCVCAE